MNALSEYLLPLIFIVVILVRFLRKGMDTQGEGEMAKTTLPGRKSGEVIDVREPVPATPVQKKAAKKTHRPASNPLRTPLNTPATSSVPVVEAGEEYSYEPVLNIENADDIKKAIIYTEIFKRKEY